MRMLEGEEGRSQGETSEPAEKQINRWGRRKKKSKWRMRRVEFPGEFWPAVGPVEVPGIGTRPFQERRRGGSERGAQRPTAPGAAARAARGKPDSAGGGEPGAQGPSRKKKRRRRRKKKAGSGSRGAGGEGESGGPRTGTMGDRRVMRKRPGGENPGSGPPRAKASAASVLGQALCLWFVGATVLGLVEMELAARRPGVNFNSYSLFRFMLYYWVPGLAGGLTVSALLIAARAAGRRPNALRWAAGLFSACVSFVYVGLSVNRALRGSPTSPQGMAANAALLVGAGLLGLLAGKLAGAVAAALKTRRRAAYGSFAALAACLVYLAWSWGNVTAGARNVSASNRLRPNVILVTVDALRADHLSLNGYDRNTDPTLRKLASQGVNFSRAFSQATITVRSMSSLFTSLYPQMHGMMKSGLRLAPEVKTLPELLWRHGYNTAGFGGGNPSLFASGGIVRGYDYYDDCRLIRSLVPQRLVESLGLVRRLNFGSAREAPPARVVLGKARSWLEAGGAKSPFFLFVHLMDVHSPYLPPHDYATLFGPGLEGGPDDVSLNEKCNRLVLGKSEKFFELVRRGEFDRMHELDVKPEELSRRELGRLMDLYDAEIAYADHELGRFFDYLSEQGLLDNTLVVVTADHGEGFLDHGRLFHSGDLVYDELMHVPLIMRYPRVIPEGTEVSAPVRLIDVMPTVLEAAGIAPEEGSGLQGESLLPLIRGDENAYERRMRGEVYCEGALVSCVRTVSWKYIDSRGHDTYELYDLESDPHETVNLYEERPDVAVEMAGRLAKYRRLVEEYRAEHAPPVPIAVDQETRKRLRALGYVE